MAERSVQGKISAQVAQKPLSVEPRNTHKRKASVTPSNQKWKQTKLSFVTPPATVSKHVKLNKGPYQKLEPMPSSDAPLCGYDGCYNRSLSKREYVFPSKIKVWRFWCSEHKWCTRCHYYEDAGQCIKPNTSHVFTYV